jgi:hypothetical protein
VLVLVSFGLVLLATILLVVGLLNDDGLTLIYLSIAASATAAVVLYLAFRLARPKDEAPAQGPAPLDEDLASVAVTDDRVSRPTADASTAVAVTDDRAPRPQADAAEPEPVESAPAPTEPVPVAAADDDWLADDAWEGDDVQFPIADYDDLTVGEILPLLPQLYSDELDVVYEREASTKNRSTILDRLDQLKDTGTEADGFEPVADVEVADDPRQDVVAPAPAATEADTAPDSGTAAETTPAAASAPTADPAPRISLLDDDEADDDGYFFPIADYDQLSVSQIMPLLSQLEIDELEDVRDREVQGANRQTLVLEIDRYLSGELQAFTWHDDEAEPEPVAEEPEPEPEPEPVAEEPEAPSAERDRLPIADYDELNVADIRPLLGDLSPAELEQVLAYEEARDNRKTIVGDITRRLQSAPPATTAPGRRSATKTATRSVPKAPTKVASKARKAPRKGRNAAKKKAATATRFPIANYDELKVADIRPRLSKLSPAQLEQVREREAAGAARKTILKDIDNRLS